MKYIKMLFPVLAVMFLAVVLIGCNNPTSADRAAGDTTAPTILFTVPASGEPEAPLNRGVLALFSKKMDYTSITTNEFTLYNITTGTPVTVEGTVTYEGSTATAVFRPKSPFLSMYDTYEAIVSTDVKDLSGNKLAAIEMWTFTAGAADSEVPTVIRVTPSEDATGVAFDKPILAKFSEPMDGTTVTPVTFSLSNETTGLNIACTVSFRDDLATLTPIGGLSSDTSYEVTISTDVTDLAALNLATAKIWKFRTGTLESVSGAAVDLGSAAHYAILAKSAVTTTGTTLITGDVGVSPAAATYVTGFTKTQDGTNQFWTADEVDGKIYDATDAPPTPTLIGVSIGDMQLAYTDAQGRTNPTATELGAGNISGMTLAQGVYKWGTGVYMDDTGVTLSGSATDVWIFQIAQNLTVASGAIVTLSGGAKAENVFWAVAGKATLNAGCKFKGNILCQTQINFITGARLDGRALAQTQVTMQSNEVLKP